MQIRLFIITLLGVCLFSGCTKTPRPVGFPTLYPCEITITQEGQPLENALVRLMPESGSFEWIISSKTNASGVALFSTHAKYPGAPAGTFKVCVSKIEEEPTKLPPFNKDAPFEERMAWEEKYMNEKRQKYKFVKSEYNDVRKTPHSITVTKGKNRETFDVGEAVKILVK
jgi:hypothetical protein